MFKVDDDMGLSDKFSKFAKSAGGNIVENLGSSAKSIVKAKALEKLGDSPIGSLVDSIFNLSKKGKIKNLRHYDMHRMGGPVDDSTDAQMIELSTLKVSVVKKSSGGDVLGWNEDKKILSVAFLPLPQDIKIQTTPSWDKVDGGLLGKVADGVKIDNQSSAGFSSDVKLSDVLEQGAASAKRSALDAIAKVTVGSDGGAQIADASQARVYNNRELVLFQGISHREFSVTFDFAPTDRDQTQQLLDFLLEIHESAVPEVYKAYFTYPAILGFKILTKEGAVILDRGEVIITGINCDYTPDGVWATFDNGQPVHIKLSIDFKERELPTKKTIKRLFGA